MPGEGQRGGYGPIPRTPPPRPQSQVYQLPSFTGAPMKNAAYAYKPQAPQPQSYLGRMFQGAQNAVNPLEWYRQFRRDPLARSGHPLGIQDEATLAAQQGMWDSFKTPEGQGAMLTMLLGGLARPGPGKVPKSPIDRVKDYPTGQSNFWKLKNTPMGAHGGFGGRMGDVEDRRIIAQQRQAPSIKEHVEGLDRARQIERLTKGQEPYRISDHNPEPPLWSGGARVDPYATRKAFENPEGFFFDAPKKDPRGGLPAFGGGDNVGMAPTFVKPERIQAMDDYTLFDAYMADSLPVKEGPAFTTGVRGARRLLGGIQSQGGSWKDKHWFMPDRKVPKLTPAQSVYPKIFGEYTPEVAEAMSPYKIAQAGGSQINPYVKHGIPNFLRNRMKGTGWWPN